MGTVIQIIFGAIFGFFSRLVHYLFGKRHQCHQDCTVFEFDCGCCSKCASARRQRLEAKCCLVENYISDNLALCERLEEIMQLQALNISRQLTMLQNLNMSSEHLKSAISDCLEEHLKSIYQFTQGVERLEMNHNIETKVAIASYDGRIEDFQRSLMGSIVSNEKRNITDLIHE